MRTRYLLAVVTIAIGTATALAVPASADDQTDQAFINGLKQKGISVSSPGFAIGLAQSTCDVLRHGTATDALKLIIKRTKWPQQQAADFGGFAAYAYCPDAIPGAKGH
jgi:Protein of unknown function (DUF732)